MIEEFKEFLKNKEDLGILYKKPIRERIYPSLKIFNKNVFHEIDVLYLPYSQHNQSKQYYTHNYWCYNGFCDSRPLKSNSMDEIIKNWNDIYKKSKYLERPKTMQGDNQFDNKKFRDSCNGYVDGGLNISGNEK